VARSINIIVPIYNEDESVLVWLQQLVSYLGIVDRLVVVDASDTSTAGDLSSHAIFQQDQVFYLSSNKGRAVQMNAGAEFLLSRIDDEQVASNILWFLHSDSGLSSLHLRYLSQLNRDVKWGRFDVQLRTDLEVHAKRFPFSVFSDFKFFCFIVAKFINLRSRLTQVMTGDQGIFIRSDIFKQLGGYADLPLMEDVEISKRLRELAKADCNGPVLQTSARRWQKHGWIKTVLLMWQLRLMYWLGVSPEVLVKKYYG
jgi:rSAM/selenodomain-associated transferase 2